MCGYGAVGAGIAKAFVTDGWKCTSVDPYAAGADLQIRLENLDEGTLWKWMK